MTSGKDEPQVCRVVICQCTSDKRDERASAGEIYDESRYFRKQRDYALAVADKWFIQSAKHGLLKPETVIEPYDKRPSDIDDTNAWAESIAVGLGGHVTAGATVEVLGGYDYADPLTPELERLGYDVVEPLRGLRMGPRENRLVEHTPDNVT